MKKFSEHVRKLNSLITKIVLKSKKPSIQQADKKYVIHHKLTKIHCKNHFEAEKENIKTWDNFTVTGVPDVNSIFVTGEAYLNFPIFYHIFE